MQEYVADDFAGNDADASKISKAEKRAAAKTKVPKKKKRKSSSNLAFSMPSSSFDSSEFGSGIGVVTSNPN